MQRILSFLLLMTAAACSQVKQAQVNPPLTTAIPALHITTDTGRFDLKMEKLDVNVRVVGNIATTTFDITFYNGRDRVLEGEFDFPLADGQTISRYALETAGQLREGVVVEKAKARVAYEATVRKGIDPGLVEKTAGNNFRTRIYPIPSKGRKRVVIGIEQKLGFANETLLYGLPLQAKEPIDEFSIEATVLHTESPKNEGYPFPGFAFRRTEIGYEGGWRKRNFTADHLFSFSLPFDDEPAVYTETLAGKTYFYAVGKLKAEAKEKAKPSVVGLLWDVSASAEKRNLQKELSVIQDYLSKLGSVKLLLVPFHISPQPVQEFSITNGDASALLAKLKTLSYDGGTQLGALNLPAYSADEFLLFSDGLSTFGKKEMVVGNKPVYTIVSSPSADYAYLKSIAQQTGGAFVDLSKAEAANTAERLWHPSLHLTASKVVKGAVQDWVAEADEAAGMFSASGILMSDDAGLELGFGFEQEAAVSQSIAIKKEQPGTEGVARVWASMQIGGLEPQFAKNKERITALGKEFSIVTQNTSLLVLDRVEDYVEHEITPPAELQQEYFALLKDKQAEKRDAKEQAMNDAVQTMEGLKTWWNTVYTERKKKPQSDEAVYERIEAGSASRLQVADSSMVYHYSQNQRPRDMAVTPPPPPPPPHTPPPPIETSKFIENIKPVEKAVEPPPTQEKLEDVQVSEKSQEGERVSGPPPPPLVDQGTGAVTSNERSDPETINQSVSQINPTQWKPDAAYLKELDKTNLSNAWATYLTLKKQYAAQPSFYFDVARWFFDKGQKGPALLVLSNVAELKLESPELLRMMAYQLLDMEQKELAVETFRQILDLREEEPQAYRDLALALNEAGRYQEAVDNLYKVISSVWNNRFDGVTAISLNEMNAVITAHKEAVNTSGIDSRLIYPMPVDVRITIDWNTDNSDIDLWVTDPKKEKCFYQHKETATGGHISNDMTQDYGPEEFAVKKAASGEYLIEANLFGDTRQTIGGPITIRADLYTDFGKPTQKHKRINFRVTEAKEVVKIGSLKFG